MCEKHFAIMHNKRRRRRATGFVEVRQKTICLFSSNSRQPSAWRHSFPACLQIQCPRWTAFFRACTRKAALRRPQWSTNCKRKRCNMTPSKIYFLLSTYILTLFISLLFKIQVQVYIKYYHITTSHTTHHIVEATVPAKTCTISYVTGTTSSRPRMREKKQPTCPYRRFHVAQSSEKAALVRISNLATLIRWTLYYTRYASICDKTEKNFLSIPAFIEIFLTKLLPPNLNPPIFSNDYFELWHGGAISKIKESSKYQIKYIH